MNDSVRILDTLADREVLTGDELRYELPSHVFSVEYGLPYFIPTSSDLDPRRKAEWRKLSSLSVSPNDSTWAAVAWNGAGFEVLLKRAFDPRLIVVGWFHHAKYDSLFWSPDSRYLLIPGTTVSNRSNFGIYEILSTDSIPVSFVEGWSGHEGWFLAEKTAAWDMQAMTVRVMLGKGMTKDSLIVHELLFGTSTDLPSKGDSAAIHRH